jgi:hypothetical protein
MFGERIAAVAMQPFFAHPEWADHPTDEAGKAIVGRWVQPGEVVRVSSLPEHWRDYYGAYLVGRDTHLVRQEMAPEPAPVSVVSYDPPKNGIVKRKLKTK